MPYLVVIYGVIIVIVLVDIVSTDGARLRAMPKVVWLLLSMTLPLVGPIAWLALGRSPRGGAAPAPPADKPRVQAAETHQDTETQAALFNAQVRERADQQRRLGRRQRDAEDRPPDTRG